LYEALDGAAEKHPIHGRVWEGKFTELFSTLRISNAHYAKVTTTLYELGCITQIRKGARGVTTMIAVHRPPSVEAMASAHGLQSRLTNPSAHDKLSQRVSVLEGRFQGIDVAKYIANTEARLKKLEAASRKDK